MKKLMTLAALASVAATVLVPPSLAASDCVQTSLTGQAHLIFATGAIEGLLTGTMDGEPASVFSSTTITGQEERGSVLFLTTSHVLTIVDGAHAGKRLSTVDNARLVPLPTPGVFRAVSNLGIVGGGSGFFVGVGTIDFRAGITATWIEIHGQVCGL